MPVRTYTACSRAALGLKLIYGFISKVCPGKGKGFPAPWELAILLALCFLYTKSPGLATTCETFPSLLMESLARELWNAAFCSALITPCILGGVSSLRPYAPTVWGHQPSANVGQRAEKRHHLYDLFCCLKEETYCSVEAQPRTRVQWRRKSSSKGKSFAHSNHHVSLTEWVKLQAGYRVGQDHFFLCISPQGKPRVCPLAAWCHSVTYGASIAWWPGMAKEHCFIF